jgi:hypothetical protein
MHSRACLAITITTLLTVACDRPDPVAPDTCDAIRAERAEVTRTEIPLPLDSLRILADEVTHTNVTQSPCIDDVPTANVPADRTGVTIVVRRKP